MRRIRWRLPVLHSGAIACAAVAYLTAFYLSIGELTFSAADPYGAHLLRLMFNARSGTALAGLFLVLAALSELLARMGRSRHAVIYLGGCGVVAAAGLLLVTVHGIWTGGIDAGKMPTLHADALRAAILYAVYGAGSLALTARWRRLGLSYLGLVLVASAALWALWWQSAAQHVGPLWGAVLAIEGLVMTAMAAVLHRYAKGTWHDPWKMVEEAGRVGQARAASAGPPILAVGGPALAATRCAGAPELVPPYNYPRSQGLSLADLYRIPLAHVGEAAAMLAAALTAWTAWCDRAIIAASPTPAPIVASAAMAAAYFLLAWLYRSPARTWIASSIALVGAVHALNFNYFAHFDYIGPNWTIALLGHATLALVAVSCLDWLGHRTRNREEQATGPSSLVSHPSSLIAILGDPLANSALLSSLLVLLPLIFGRSAGSLWLACCFPWLAGVWLVLARRKRSMALFAAHQAALAFAVLAAATVWMKRAQWITPIKLPTETPNLLERIASYSHVVFEPRNLQTYGIALGLLSLAWVVVRIIDLRRWLPSHFGRGTMLRTVPGGEGALLPSPSGRGAGGEGLSGSSDANFPHPNPLPVGEGTLTASLLQTPYSVNWCIRHGVVAMQFLVAACCVLKEVNRELLGGIFTSLPGVVSNHFGPAAWILLGTMVVMLLAALWQRWGTAEMVAALLTAATLPCLIAGRFTTDLAVTSTLRWTVAAGFLACSAAVWGRGYLAAACRLLRAGPFAPGAPTPQPAAPRLARGVMLVTMLLPMLAITVVAALLWIGGFPPAGPVAKTFFAALGQLFPLALVIAALVGHALRERSAGYAFSAGLVLEMAVGLGYAVHAAFAKQPFDTIFVVALIQLFAITAAVWAIVWLIARKRVDVRRELHLPSPAGRGTMLRTVPGGEGISSDPSSLISHPSSFSRGLMGVQIGMAVAANVLVLGIALLVLALLPTDWQTWSMAAGRPLGWIALVLPLAALQLCGRLRPHAVGLAGMALLGLLACTICGLPPAWHIDPIWGYRTLMLAWAVYALLVVAATWWVASLRTTADAEGPPQGLIRMAAVWVRVAGMLAVLLGLKAAFLHDGEQLWAAAAIAVASGAGATMAVWRRCEGWAFAAALGVNVAASLVVWHLELLHKLSFNDYWLRLVQANVIASAAVAVVWLAARKRLYQLREMTLLPISHEPVGCVERTAGEVVGSARDQNLENTHPASGPVRATHHGSTVPVLHPPYAEKWGLGDSPLLATQVLLPVLGNCVLAVLPVAWLMHTPAGLPRWMNELAAPQGWIGLLLAAAAAAWYLRQSQLGSLLHVLGGLALGAGVLAACSMDSIYPHAPANSWIAYHALTTAWAAAGLLVFAIALGESTLGGRRLLAPRSLIEPWLAAIGALTVALAALHAFHDPARPWWAAGAILTVSLTAGLVAVVLRKPVHVYLSGVLLNLAGTIVWWAWSPSGPRWPAWTPADVAGLAQANVLFLAIGSVVWSLVDILPRRSNGGPALASSLVPPYGLVPHPKADGQPPFAHLAAQLGAVLLGLVTAAGVAATLLQGPRIPVGRLDWIALAGIVTATAVCLRKRRERFPLPTLYCLGLSAVGLGLLARQLTPRMFCWSAVNELAGYALAVAAIAWFLRKVAGTRRVPSALRSQPRVFHRSQKRLLADGTRRVPTTIVCKRRLSPWRARWPCGSRSISTSTAAAMKASAGPSPAGWLPCRDYSCCCWRQSSWRASRVEHGGPAGNMRR